MDLPLIEAPLVLPTPADAVKALRDSLATVWETSKRKLNVTFHEFNVRMGNCVYLPIVSGILRAYAETDPDICERYAFAPFLYQMDSVENVWKRYIDAPHVAAFSVSMWNEQLNLAIAKGLKETYSDCLIVFGGYSVPHHPEAYMERYQFIDVCVRAEGEEAFLNLLKRYGTHEYFISSFHGIPGLTYRLWGGHIVSNPGEYPFVKDLDKYPSPYLSGMFDDLIKEEGLQWQSIVEWDRGCSFPCSFCAWGRGGETTKYRFHSLQRVQEEINWIARHKIPYCFNASSNFAMHPRDREIAEYLVVAKERWGYPTKFRTCFGKNTDEKIFQVASRLHGADMEKGITLARQSNDPTTLENIRRQNISLATYRNLQERFNEKGIPVYIELILGLPGETVASWKKGIDDCLIKADTKTSLFIYLCQCLANTELANPAYQARHGIVTKRIELQEIHGSPRQEGWVTEYEDVVVETATMPHVEWREMCKFGWLTMFLHSMKAGFFVLAWLWDRFHVPPSAFVAYLLERAAPDTMLGREFVIWNRLLDRMIIASEGRGQVLEGYGDLYWDVEEAALIRASENWQVFYDELDVLLGDFLRERQIDYHSLEKLEVVLYQNLRMPRLQYSFRDHLFFFNIPEYFDRVFSRDPVAITEAYQELALQPKDFDGDKERFARETVLWARKSGTMLVPCKLNTVE